MKPNYIIEDTLKRYPETRNSDRKLILKVWSRQKWNFREHFDEFFIHQAISPETIRRTRQKLQQEGKYKADEAVDEARFDKYLKTKHNIAYTTPGELF